MTEAMKQALDALERYQVKRQDFERFADVIAALEKTLEQDMPKIGCVNHDCDKCKEPVAGPHKSVSGGEPVAHCEAGPNYCWKCLEEAKPTYGSEEIRKLREVNKRLADHIPNAKKMVEALREIGDFAHDKSTGPTVPDALWEIRSMAYNALVEQRLSNECAHPQPPQPKQEQSAPRGGAPVAWTLTETLEKKETTTTGRLWFSNPQNSLWTPLYTTPPQRTWVGLTDDEWEDLSDRYGLIIFGGFKHEIEAKLKEKNT